MEADVSGTTGVEALLLACASCASEEPAHWVSFVVAIYAPYFVPVIVNYVCSRRVRCAPFVNHDFRSGGATFNCASVPYF